jgi:hypothetical protein
MTCRNYWEFPGIRPEPLVIAAARDSAETHRVISKRATSRLDKARPGKQIENPLVYWIRSDPRWREDPRAVKALRALQPAAHRHVLQRARHGHKDLAALAKTIAKEQTSYAAACGGSSTAELKKQFHVSDRVIRRVRHDYQRQADRLLGRTGALPPAALREAKARGYLVKEGRLVGTPIVGMAGDVFHWFAHALNNLARRRNWHPSLPWRDSCARRCLSTRDRLAREKSG